MNDFPNSLPLKGLPKISTVLVPFIICRLNWAAVEVPELLFTTCFITTRVPVEEFVLFRTVNWTGEDVEIFPAVSLAFATRECVPSETVRESQTIE